MTTGPAVLVRGLRVSYGTRRVLDGVDLSVEAGTVCALLGPNGAGKTTVVNVLTTLLPPDAGEVRVAGCDVRRDPARVRAAIGLTGQFAAVDDLLTGAENLLLIARLQHLPRGEARRRTGELLERFGLTALAGRRPSTYSGGERRRLDLAMGLVGRPQVVVLDEPTTGLDPRSRRETWDVVRDLAADGSTVLLTTQHLQEAEHLAHRVALLDGGVVVAEGTVAQLEERVPGSRTTLRFADATTLERARRVLPDMHVRAGDLSGSVPTAADGRSVQELLRRLEAAGVPVERVGSLDPDLDDVFLALTGRPGRTEQVAS